MRRLLKNNKAFTLPEVLVGAIIVSIIGAVGYFTLTVLSKTAETSRNRVIAINLNQKSLEEVRRAAVVFFDDLETCDFVAGNTCGLEDTSTILPEFTRTLEVTNEVAASTELKRVLVTTTWQELGRAQQVQSLILLSRPPDPLPGSLIGKITREGSPTTLVGGAEVRIVYTDDPESRTVISLGAEFSGEDHNYDFSVPPPGGRFELRPGNWELTVDHSDYEPFGPVDVIIDSNLETTFDLELIPLPEPGHIVVRPVDALGGFGLSFNGSSSVRIYEGGSQEDEDYGGSVFDFEIPFSDTTPRNFTVRTNNSYRSGYVGNYNCIPQRSEGWSNSTTLPTINCSAPFEGPAASDYVLNPGQTINVDAPLVNTPTTTVQGIVRDEFGNPMENARVYVRWHNGSSSYPWIGKPAGNYVTTNSSGFYSMTIPAAQDFFTDTTGNYMQLRARATVPQLRCCDAPGSTNVYDGWDRVGPLNAGSTFNKDFTLVTNVAPLACGNANGNIRNDKTNAPLNGANIRLTGLNPQSYAGGFYQYKCTDPGAFRVRAGNHHMTASRGGFYNWHSAGNNIYAGSGRVRINDSLTTNVPLINMWPVGTGNIHVTIVDVDTGAPIEGASVSLNGPSSGNITTNGGGQANFNNRNESWPAPEVVGDPYYNQSTNNYTVNVSAPPVYINKSESGIILPAGTTQNITIQMQRQGGI